MNEAYIRNLNKNLGRLAEKSEKLNAETRIRRPSDDPVGTALAMRLRRELSAMEQFKSNAEDAITWLRDTESALTNTGNILHRLKELTVQAANGPLTKDDRQQVLHEVEELRDQLLQEANSAHVRRHMFSGYHTDKATFVKVDINGIPKVVMNPYIYNAEVTGIDPDEIRVGLADVGKDVVPGEYKIDITGGGSGKATILVKDKDDNVVQVIPNEIDDLEDFKKNGAKITVGEATKPDEQFTLLLGSGIELNDTGNLTIELDIKPNPGQIDYNLGHYDSIPTNLIGPDVFQKVFDTVYDLEEALNGNEQDKLSGDILKDIDDSTEQILKYRSQVGARTKRLEMTIDKMDANYLDYRELLSKTEDVNVAEMFTELKMDETVYRASLAIGARIIQPNLADFLR